ncbi:MAG TPA: carboxypeptidase regulatory-like domain-containing protein [Bryobacteraceae bacterium]|nr:carboxypeptidase regulatory-like domain-containing protein [Bryobacteraceae bacterium]
MRILSAGAGILAIAAIAFCQSDRGTITGTVTDATGAVVAGAALKVQNTQTGAVYPGATSATGNYTLAQLPAGQYEMSVEVPGFKTYIRRGLVVDVAQTYRVDVSLQVGTRAEAVTVTEAAPLLKTDSGELSHNISVNSLDDLPVLPTGAQAGASGIRNPYSIVQLLPGGSFATQSSGPGSAGADMTVRVNGAPANTQAMLIEGQDATNGWYSTQSQTQPSVEAIQEFAVQTSNFAAEFGQVGGGLFNTTMKSGTNQYHGSAYDYFVNEALNAGSPFTNDGNGHLLRPRQRRNDYGFTLGGPVRIPKLFNGHDKLFFFFNWEQFRQTTITNNVPTTVPTLAYRAGNFQQALTNKNLGTDALGRPILENTIYDPSSSFVDSNGLVERNPFPNNTIPSSMIDPVAAKVQALIPLPTNGGLTNNYLPTYTNPIATTIPSLKGDYQISSNSKLAVFWSLNRQDNPNNGVLPEPIRSSQPRSINSNTYRVNYDQTLTPTLLLHVGAGLIDTKINDHSQRFDSAAQLGLTGANSTLFPVFGGLSEAQGGLSSGTGPGNQIHVILRKPTFNTSATWVRNNHTLKFGAEAMANGYQMFNETYSMGWLTFGPNETGLPSLNGVSLPGTVGYSYASFLLGAVDNGYDAVPATTHMGAHSLSGFAQDTWKVTRTLTVDYGLRYDFSTYLRDGNGYYGAFSPSTANPSAGGLPGAIIYEGNGGGRCNCVLAHNYPYAFGPRLGVAWQFLPKTVLRVGAGVSYFKTDDNQVGFSAGSEYLYSTSTYGSPAYYMRNGIPYKITFPNFDPGQYLFPGSLGSAPQEMDQNAGRPARQMQWSAGIQREVFPNLLVEATYVGNRGVWWNSGGMINPNAISEQDLEAHGLSLNNPGDLKILAAPLNSATAIAAGFGNPPYAGFPLTATVAQSLRPFPQYGAITNWHWVPDGDTWYESLQIKVTKRFSHGLQAGGSFTWAKQLDAGVEDDYGRGDGVFINNVFNRANQKTLSAYDQPLLLVISGSYLTPKWKPGDGFAGRTVGWLTRDWQIGTLLRYASGLPIQSPTSTSNLAAYTFQTTLMDRVPGVPLFTHDLNCHCFDPNTTFVLNPAAWVNPPAGQYGTAASYYNDYRYQRRPAENISLARNFRMKERMNIQIRAEFTNVFNRTEMNNPTALNASATQTRNLAGQTTAGFGYVNVGTTFGAPRTGQIVAKFEF